MAVNRIFRTDPATGLVFHDAAEKLMKANAVAAVVHLLLADWFYLVLTAHGVNMLVFWIIFFEIAVLYFAGSTLLKCRLATPRLAWAGFWLMVIGALVNNYAVWRGD